MGNFYFRLISLIWSFCCIGFGLGKNINFRVSGILVSLPRQPVSFHPIGQNVKKLEIRCRKHILPKWPQMVTYFICIYEILNKSCGVVIDLENSKSQRWSGAPTIIGLGSQSQSSNTSKCCNRYTSCFKSNCHASRPELQLFR